MEQRKNVLLIGVRGNAGRHIAKYLIKKYNVTALIRSPLKYEMDPQFFKTIQGDATDEKSLD
jgi:nucleoside-diphosphate-sugar epimerase